MKSLHNKTMLKQIYKAAPLLILAFMLSAAFEVVLALINIRTFGGLDLAMQKDVDGLTAMIPEILLLALLSVPLGLASSIFKGAYMKRSNLSVKGFYITGVFSKNIAEFQKENTAGYLSRLMNDCNTMEDSFIKGIYTVGYGLIRFVVGIWIVSTVNPWILLLAAGVTLVNIIISLITKSPVERAYKERSDMFDGYLAYIKEVLSAFPIVKSCNLSKKVTKDYYEKSDAIQKKGYLIERLTTFINASQSMVMQLCTYGAICVLGYLALKGKITIGGLLLVFNGLQQIAWPLMQMTEAMPKLFSAKILAKKMDESLVNTDQHEEALSLPEFKEEIELRDVGFCYEDGESLTLKDVTITLKKNGKYLIAGPSGGGKSTLLKLLRKYFSPTEGKIMIDGLPLYDVKKEDYFSLIGNIEQNVFIFEDTLFHNLTLYKDYTEQEVWSAVKNAGLEDFVNALPNGFSTMLYDNGRNISGGERSRIVIARALLAKASILFMDEAFASLDMERAREIEKTILDLNDITVINVSHVIFEESKERYDGIFSVKRGVRQVA